MKTIAFVISHKENEKRRALIPEDISRIKNRSFVFVENGYGDVLGYSDDDYRRLGVNVCTRQEALSKDIICDPKVGDAEYLHNLKIGQYVFGWVHAVQNKDITDCIINAKATAIAWEDMNLGNRHLFWRNNEIAGEAAIMHAFSLHGIFPYDAKVALIGSGNVARGAYRILVSLGADVTQYNRRTESLLRKELHNYDVVVNAILWDTNRKDHIIYRNDLKMMKRGSLIVDISCDRNGGIETSMPTTIQNPMYDIDGISHYVVDHTPSLFYKTVSKSLSNVCAQYVDDLIEDSLPSELVAATIIKDGVVVDERINEFQNRYDTKINS